MSLTSKKYILLFATLLIIVFIDRLLLFYLGLPLWEWDEKLHYKHRRNITRNWNEYGKKPIIINEYGQHDDSYPIRKEKKELRILNLGDSITMGHGVTKDETYSKYLEIILSDSINNYQTIQAINTGVQGYSTFQELEVLRDHLYLQPDVVTLGFCLNDITEPFEVNKNLGGTGLDYHRVTQAPNKFLSYLLNETGFGRLIQEIRISQFDTHQAKDDEINEIKKMLLHQDDRVYKAQFNFILNNLLEIISLCYAEGVDLIILIFPYTFQVDSNLRWVQDILRKEFSEHGVSCIDFLEIFENITRSDANKLQEYYLDEDHLTPLGHKIVAMEISKIIINELKSKVN